MEQEEKLNRILDNQQIIASMLVQVLAILKENNDTSFIEDYLANVLGFMTERTVFKNR